MLSNLLNDTKRFKVLSKKYKPNGEIEFTQVCFSSTTKTVINHTSVSKILLKKFYTGLITGLMKDLAGLLN